jgi:pentose-5-phosphate-3-epimerase
MPADPVMTDDQAELTLRHIEQQLPTVLRQIADVIRTAKAKRQELADLEATRTSLTAELHLMRSQQAEYAASERKLKQSVIAVRAEVEAEGERLRRSLDALRQEETQAQVAAQAAHQERAARLAALDRDLAAREAKLAKLEADLASFARAHGFA